MCFDCILMSMCLFCMLQESNNPKCNFREQQSEDDTHTQFVSVYNEKWKMGFKKNGRTLRGNEWKNNNTKKCFRFLKRGDEQGSVDTGSQPGPGVDFSNVDRPHRLRHLATKLRTPRPRKFRKYREKNKRPQVSPLSFIKGVIV